MLKYCMAIVKNVCQSCVNQICAGATGLHNSGKGGRGDHTWNTIGDYFEIPLETILKYFVINY